MIGLRNKLNNPNVSPLVKSIILKERAGITLTGKENRLLKKELQNEVVSTVQPSTDYSKMMMAPKPDKDTERESNFNMTREEFEKMVREIVMDIKNEEELDEIIESLTKNYKI
tara:strand:- start:4528 stop:4866 length:339 start_codon:yes stop_codon:yes gene_type:complete